MKGTRLPWLAAVCVVSMRGTVVHAEHTRSVSTGMASVDNPPRAAPRNHVIHFVNFIVSLVRAANFRA
jgi:hypothetical protein